MLFKCGFAKIVPGIDIATLVFILADRTLGKTTLDSGKLDLGLVSAGSNGIEPLFIQGNNLCTMFHSVC